MFPYLVCLYLFCLFYFSGGIWPDNLTILETEGSTDLTFPKVSSIKHLEVENPCKNFSDVSNEDFNFANLENLEYLEFFNCPTLTSLPPNAFESAKKLKKLELDENDNLKVIDKDALKGLIELELIDFSSNSMLNELPNGFFGNVRKLQEIDISDTKMR